ncbi:cellulase family glycosylhydrolase [Serratia sp. PF2-63]|uniref:cellulase family glycosylhydrolase n=1 Tax=unclassified Serratia (in: enterobacteria) TaxID=2647522 RepID=UPI0024AF6C1F|nr:MULTISPECIES: cellulase family glycosylhydrolase [unclassified Serratia (in: enterobacteria)]MDI6973054.1 cellulase family glycosylhydrolase [Serratia sp. Se-RSBMAAmG]MDI9262023.1 cellulase family glycosylhydrolase [Serratia sp. PF2-63]MDI9269013.1 cellulase family glycosylhydrolase [Serratia sp. PF-27]
MNHRQLLRSLAKKAMITAFGLLCGTSTHAFEVGINMHVRHYPNTGDYYLNLAKEYGFTSIREDYPWAQVEGPQGKYSLIGNLGKVDAVFAQSEKNFGLSSMLVLAYTNPLYDKGGYPQSEAAIDAFANYAYWTAKRFKGKVKYYEIWNEWLVGTGVRGAKNPPSETVFFELVKKTALAIKKADPDAIVMTGSLNPLKEKDNAWLDKLLDMDLMHYVDAISVHPYSYRNPDNEMRKPEGNLAGIDIFEDKLRKKTGRTIPIYITEMGFPTHIGDGGISGNLAAQNVIKYTLLAKSRDYIKGIWWYDLIDDGANDRNREHRFGFISQNLSPKPAATYLKKISNYVEKFQVVHYKQSIKGENSIQLSNGEEKAVITWDNKPEEKETNLINRIAGLAKDKKTSDVTPLLIEDKKNNTIIEKKNGTPTLRISN